jgi:peroxiredoxin
MRMTIALTATTLLFISGTLAGELHPGDVAPAFRLPYATRDTINNDGMSLSDALQKDLVILAFYPADWSGGCTTEMCTMRDNFGALSSLGVTVLGISGDYVYSHHEWAKYHNLPFALLSDHLHSVGKAYDSYNEAKGQNKRTIFIVKRDGRIAYADYAYKAGDPKSFEALKDALKGVQ